MSALARFTSMAPRSGAARSGADLLLRAIRLTGRAASAPGRVPPDADEAPARITLRGRRPMLRFGMTGLAAAGLAAAALGTAEELLASRTASGEAAATAAAVPIWSEIRRPLALYDLPGSEFSKLPATYRARRRDPDGAREDVMTFGRLGDQRSYLQLSLLRPGAAAEEAGEALPDALARLAGARGTAATRIRAAAPVETRFGRFEAADLLLWDAGASTACLGFRGGGAVLRVAGFACGAPDRPMGRAALACALDRLDLVSAGEDAPLRALFVAAARRNGATCLGEPSLATGGALGLAPRRLGWLDPDSALPPLRGLFEATIRQR